MTYWEAVPFELPTRSRPTILMSVICCTMPRSRKSGILLLGLVPTLLICAGTSGLPSACMSSEQELSQAYNDGMRLLREKQYQAALEQFRSLEHKSPQKPQGYTGEGIALALMGKQQDSINAFRKALEVDRSFWVARRELGIIYWQANQKELAIKELSAILKLFPNDPAVNLIFGQYEFDRGNYAQASAYLKKAHIEHAADAKLPLMAAEAQLRSGLKEEARQVLHDLEFRQGLIPQERFRLGWLLGDAGEYARSVHVLESLPDNYPDQFGRSYGIALAYYEEGQFSNSIGILKDLRDRRIVRPEVFNLLGAAEEENHDTIAAYNAFGDGIHAFPKDDQNDLSIATLCAAHYNFDLAAQILSSGISLIPNDYKLYLTRGAVRRLARQLQLAETDFERAVSLAPDRGDVYLGLGICFMDENKIDMAIAAFREGIHYQPNDLMLHYFLSDSLFRKGITHHSPAYAEALGATEASLRVEPGFAYGYLQRGRLELLNHEVENALVDLERAHALAPESREITYQLAVAYRTVGKRAEADKLFSIVSEASEKDAADFRTGQLQDAIIELSKAKRPSDMPNIRPSD